MHQCLLGQLAAVLQSVPLGNGAAIDTAMQQKRFSGRLQSQVCKGTCIRLLALD